VGTPEGDGEMNNGLSNSRRCRPGKQIRRPPLLGAKLPELNYGWRVIKAALTAGRAMV
jgi:hypothetical protein